MKLLCVKDTRQGNCTTQWQMYGERTGGLERERLRRRYKTRSGLTERLGEK